MKYTIKQIMSGLLLLKNTFPKCSLGPYWNSGQPGEEKLPQKLFGIAASEA